MTETDQVIQPGLGWVVAVYLPRQDICIVKARFAQKNDATLYESILCDRVPSLRMLTRVFDASQVSIKGDDLIEVPPLERAIAC